jgi:hypothetical protein
MFTAGAGPRTHPIDYAPAFAQRPAIGTPIDPVAYTSSRERLAVGFLPVSLIAEHLALLPVQQLWQLSDVRYPRVGREHRVDSSRSTGGPKSLPR